MLHSAIAEFALAHSYLQGRKEELCRICRSCRFHCTNKKKFSITIILVCSEYNHLMCFSRTMLKLLAVKEKRPENPGFIQFQNQGRVKWELVYIKLSTNGSQQPQTSEQFSSAEHTHTVLQLWFAQVWPRGFYVHTVSSQSSTCILHSEFFQVAASPSTDLDHKINLG